MWCISTGIPAPEDIRALRGAALGLDFGGRIRIHIESRAVLDALERAIAELREDMHAGQITELPIADMAPGELVGIFGK